MKITVVGDILMDVDISGTATRLSPDAPVPVVDAQQVVRRAGGAGLVATMLARDGHDVELVTVLSNDAAAAQLAATLSGIRLIAGDSGAPTPVKTRIKAGGQAIVRLDQGCATPPVPAVSEEMLAAIERADAVVVADYGRGLTANPWLRDCLQKAGLRVPLVWDPHPNGTAPLPSTTVVTPNLVEACNAAAVEGTDVASAARAAAALHERWKCSAVAVTMGARGALLHSHVNGCDSASAAPLVIPARPVTVADPCGAGDRLSASMVVGLLRGTTLQDALGASVRDAVAFLAEGGVGAMSAAGLPEAPAGTTPFATTPFATPPQRSVATAEASHMARPLPGATSALRIAREVRLAGGTVVATGGCFDLLHAGHARTLVEARRLGDCLIVCLNTDDSVRRLKGPGRPLIPLEDRVDLLLALECVDAVLVFDEGTPEAAIERLKPDLWVKGGDYAPSELPEAALLQTWGGQTITVPYYPGRSTTRLATALERVG